MLVTGEQRLAYIYFYYLTSAQSCPTFCDPVDCSPLDSSIHGIFQAKYWSGLPFPTPGDVSDPGIEALPPVSPALTGRFFTTEPPLCESLEIFSP